MINTNWYLRHASHKMHSIKPTAQQPRNSAVTFQSGYHSNTNPSRRLVSTLTALIGANNEQSVPSSGSKNPCVGRNQ